MKLPLTASSVGAIRDADGTLIALSAPPHAATLVAIVNAAHAVDMADNSRHALALLKELARVLGEAEAP
jgi:hypothetical protein